MRAAVVCLNLSSSICSCSDMYSFCALGSQPPLPQRAVVILALPMLSLCLGFEEEVSV